MLTEEDVIIHVTKISWYNICWYQVPHDKDSDSATMVLDIIDAKLL